MEQRERAARAVESGSSFDREAVMLVEQSCDGVLLVHVDCELAPEQRLCMRDEGRAQASAHNPGIEEERLDLISHETHEAERRIAGTDDDPKLQVLLRSPLATIGR